MAWTKSKAGGYTKYTQTLVSTTSDVITLAGAGALIVPVADVKIHTASNELDASGAYSYELVSTTAVAEECSIPKGAHMLKVEDVTGGGVVTVYVENTATGQGSVVIGGKGADPS
tara:strand:+ start:8146 stop:8490 length:345 start_codon:yes stop_codon:yes gene_type:complete